MTTSVVHVPEKRRYELRDGDAVIGAAHYRRRPGQVVFTHTVVSDAYEGQGLGGLLAREALTDVRGTGMRIVPVCPFIAAYLRRHHEFDDVVDPVLDGLVDPVAEPAAEPAADLAADPADDLADDPADEPPYPNAVPAGGRS